MKFLKEQKFNIFLVLSFIIIMMFLPINDFMLLKTMKKPDTINSIYSILIGFIFTSLAILSSLRSETLINLAKNGKVVGIIIRIFITLISLFTVMIWPVISNNLTIYELILKISIFAFFNFTILILQILHKTIKSLPDEEREEDKEKKELKSKLDGINKNLYSISLGINKIGDKIIRK